MGWKRAYGYGTVASAVMWLGFFVVIAIVYRDPSIFLHGIIHILVGIWLLYAGICSLVNHTQFRVQGGVLRVSQEPLPWWRGNRIIGVHEVEQLFVHEEKRVENEVPIAIYTLHAILVDGSRKQLLFKSTLTKDQALLIEEKLEEYLGIIDKRVAGEVTGKQYAALAQGRRSTRRSYTDPVLTVLYQANRGDQVSFQDRDWQLEQVTQIDWNRDDSDRRLVLRDQQGNCRQLYITQHKTFLHAFEEKPLREGAIRFKKEAPQHQVQLRGVRFNRTYLQQGKIYETETDHYLWVQQWTYETTDGTQQIRILNVAGELSFYHGEALHYDPLDDRLELDDLPEEELKYRQPNWRGKDFV